MCSRYYQNHKSLKFSGEVLYVIIWRVQAHDNPHENLVLKLRLCILSLKTNLHTCIWPNISFSGVHVHGVYLCILLMNVSFVLANMQQNISSECLYCLNGVILDR
ncbi:hypothetical protein BRADI_4g27731v3 [Brachypodium distachyon]|uniref:Uncharacterized protein n=1 Tax=Brachypodium distachyon TaxID=15368 RepID=A0A2K2CQN1_BRADI|nr:hypothetical protein BRADI_4g27731v3 [Brachypodium distachyon]